MFVILSTGVVITCFLVTGDPYTKAQKWWLSSKITKKYPVLKAPPSTKTGHIKKKMF